MTLTTTKVIAEARCVKCKQTIGEHLRDALDRIDRGEHPILCVHDLVLPHRPLWMKLLGVGAG